MKFGSIDLVLIVIGRVLVQRLIEYQHKAAMAFKKKKSFMKHSKLLVLSHLERAAFFSFRNH